MSAADQNGSSLGGSRALSAPTDPIASAVVPDIKRPWTSRLLDYSAHAAMIVGLAGFAWTVSSHWGSHPVAGKDGAGTASVGTAQMVSSTAPSPKDELADLRRANSAMADDIRSLRATVTTLQKANGSDKTAAQMRTLQGALTNVQSGLASARSEASSAVATLSTKIDKMEHEPATRIQRIDERLGRLEHGSLDTGATASIAPSGTTTASAIPVPPVKPATARVAVLDDARKVIETRKTAEDNAAKAPVLPGYVVRDVYDGVAVIEGRRGPMEVVPGVSIPGAGVVRSIDRHGNGWTVTTTKGILAYAAPPRDYRRISSSRPMYPDFRDEF